MQNNLQFKLRPVFGKTLNTHNAHQFDITYYTTTFYISIYIYLLYLGFVLPLKCQMCLK